VFGPNDYFENETLWKKFTKKIEDGESKTIVTSSGVKVKPAKAKEVAKEETILNWFSPDDQDTELGEVFRTEIWTHPAVVDAYENGEEGEENIVETSEAKSHRRSSLVRSSSPAAEAEVESSTRGSGETDMDTLAAIQAAWADSDSELE